MMKKIVSKLSCVEGTLTEVAKMQHTLGRVVEGTIIIEPMIEKADTAFVSLTMTDANGPHLSSLD